MSVHARHSATAGAAACGFWDGTETLRSRSAKIEAVAGPFGQQTGVGR
jgi:hypothetical protein